MSNPGGTWKPGQSGNPKGRPKRGQTLAEMARSFLDKGTYLTVDGGRKRLKRKEAFVMRVYKDAMDGVPHAQKLLWNYVDGMPKQSIDLTSEGEQLEPMVIYLPEKDNGGLETKPGAARDGATGK